jgi:hypothetical protein
MGANVADFSVIRDEPFSVDDASSSGIVSVSWPFDFRGGFLRDLEGILTFTIHRTNDLRLQVNINNTPILEEEFVNGNFEKTFQEIFSMNGLSLVGGKQMAKFTALRGSGRVSDVIVWYRRDSE